MRVNIDQFHFLHELRVLMIHWNSYTVRFVLVKFKEWVVGRQSSSIFDFQLEHKLTVAEFNRNWVFFIQLIDYFTNFDINIEQLGLIDDNFSFMFAFLKMGWNLLFCLNWSKLNLFDILKLFLFLFENSPHNDGPIVQRVALILRSVTDFRELEPGEDKHSWITSLSFPLIEVSFTISSNKFPL